MPATVFHAFTNPAVDGTVSSVVRPANWNSQHLVSLAPSGAEMIGGFSNANGVTFATNTAGRIEASIVTNYLPLGNSTQFASAVHTHDYAASDHSHSQYLTTAAQSDHTHSQYLNTSQSSLLQHTSATSAVTANAMNTSERGNYFYTSNNTFANQTHTHGAVAFSGTNASASFTSASNGLSIQLSAAAAGGAGDGYNILAAGGSTANTTGTVVFSNSNGVSFGLNGATMTASHNGLTTAAQSNHSHNLATTTTNGSQIVVGTTNSDGATIGVPPFLTTAQPVGAYLTTARASNDAIGLNTALTGNGVSVTANSSGLSINVPAFLTTAAQSGHSHGVTLNLTNINGTTGGNSNGINLSLSAVVPAQTVQPVAYSAANGSANFSTLTFANSGGVSFSTGTQGLYATVKTDYLTTAAQSNHSHGNPSLNLTNLSGTTASNSAGFTLSLSAANPGGGGAALSAGTQSVSTGTVAFANSNGITFGMSGSNQITASHNALTTARASNDGIGLNTAGTNVTWTVNSGGISLNAGGYAGTATTFNGTNISGSMTFNSAGLRLDLSGGGGGVTNQTGPNIAAGTQTATSGTVAFANSNGITFGMSDSTQVTASFDPINIGASNLGNTAGTTGTIDGKAAQYVFVGSNNITLSQSINGSSATLSFVGGGGGGASNTQRFGWPPGNFTVVAAMGNGSFSINRIQPDCGVSATRLDVPFLLSLASSATTNTWGFAATCFGAIYTKNGSTLSSLSSGSTSFSFTLASNSAGSTQVIPHAIRPMSIPINVNMSAGEYYVGFGISTKTSSVGLSTTALGNTWSVMGGPIYSSAVPQVGDFSATTNTSSGLWGGHGIYSAAISTVPPAVSLSAINQTGSHYARGNFGMIFRNI